jgi:hypothetical protein
LSPIGKILDQLDLLVIEPVLFDSELIDTSLEGGTLAETRSRWLSSITRAPYRRVMRCAGCQMKLPI